MAMLCGKSILSLLSIDFKRKLENILISLLMGFSFTSYLIYMIGFAGFLNYKMVWVVFTFITIIAFPVFRNLNLGKIFKLFKKTIKGYWVTRNDYSILFLLVASIFVVSFLNLISSLAPPSDGDSVTYHLALPKLYVRHGMIITTPFYKDWLSPFNAEMWNIIGLLLGFNSLPLVFQWAMGIAGGLVLYLMVSERISYRAGLFTVVIYYLTPWLITLSSTAKCDPSFFAFIFMSLHLIFKWKENNSDKWLWLSAIFTGMALASKYQGLYWALTIGILLVIMLWDEWRKYPQRALKITFIFTGIALIIVSPWYLRNFFVTGDPIWPFGYSIFHSQYWSQSLHNKYLSWHQGPAVSVLSYFMGLWNITLNQSIYISGGVRIPYLPIQLSLVPGLIFFWSRLTEKQKEFMKYLFIIIIVYYTIWFFGYQQRRYLIPAMSFLLIPSSYVFWEMMKLRIGKLAVLLLLGTTLSFSISYSFIYSKQFIPVVLGIETKDEFLEKKIYFYKDLKWVNNNIVDSSKIVFTHLQTFYLDHDCLVIVPNYILEKINIMTPDEFYSFLKEDGLTHIFLPMKITEDSEFFIFASLISNLEKDGKLKIVYSNPDAKIITSRTLGLYETTTLNIYKIVLNK